MNLGIKSIVSWGCVVVSTGIFFPENSQAQTNCAIAKDLVENVNAIHLEPQPVDDVFSKKIFAEFLRSLDPHHQYLTQADSARLSRFATQIDDQLKGGPCDLISEAKTMLRSNMLSAQRFMDSVLQKPLNYKTPESIQVTRLTATSFEKTRADLKRKQLKELKYQILAKAFRLARIQNVDLNAKNFPTLEVSARQAVLVRHRNSTQLILNDPKGIETLVVNCFQKAICSSFDPHTEYFTAAEMERFNVHLRSDGMAFGFELSSTRMGEPVIERMIPGGPAWKSKMLNEGDVLISMKPVGKETIDFSEFEVEEVLDHLDNMEVREATFTLRKADGREKTVTLKKEKVENTENLISSFVLEGDVKIGYVALPGFYSSDENENGKGCAGDVAKEIIKLKKEKIAGLILDLRFNGGGSVQEAIDLAGIFIDVGPVGLMETRGSAPVTLRDMNKGSVYDGPLIILVNGFSASASELVAACIQDYNRGIIVGGNTFGKATGQTIIPNGVGVNSNGFAKVTINRIYRVTGKSLQLTGIQPDIVFPEITDLLVQRESMLRNPIMPKSISKKVYYTPLPSVAFDTVADASAARVRNDQGFASIRKLEVFLSGTIPLQPDGFTEYLRQVQSLEEELDETELTSGPYKVYPSVLNQELHQVDAYHREISEATMRDMRQSFYIREAYFIMADLLKTKK